MSDSDNANDNQDEDGWAFRLAANIRGGGCYGVGGRMKLRDDEKAHLSEPDRCTACGHLDALHASCCGEWCTLAECQCRNGSLPLTDAELRARVYERISAKIAESTSKLETATGAALDAIAIQYGLRRSS